MALFCLYFGTKEGDTEIWEPLGNPSPLLLSWTGYNFYHKAKDPFQTMSSLRQIETGLIYLPNNSISH